MPIAEPKNNLLSVLKDRINVIHYLCERLATIYGDQNRMLGFWPPFAAASVIWIRSSR